MSDATIHLPSIDDAESIRAFFEASGFTEQGLTDTLGVVVEPPLPYLRNRSRLMDLTSAQTPSNLLLRWFLLAEPAGLDAANKLIPKDILRSLVDARVLEEASNSLVARHLLLPCGEFYVASDHQARLGGDEDDGHVIHVNPASRFVCNAMLPSQVATTMDLGTGCGILALHAAAVSDHVIATDINPRAIEFARFNARLNGVENIEFEIGSGFAPVAGQQFERILCNPPFILAPGSEFVYRDNGMELDMFCRELAHEAPGHLSEGGVFQMIFEWVEFEGQSWEESIGDWFSGLPCDVWVIKEYTETPSAYTQMRLRETVFRTAEDDDAQYQSWMEYYRRHRLSNIHGGLVTMRRRSTDVWRRIEALPAPTKGPFGADIATGFLVADFMERHSSDASLLEAILRLSPEVVLEQSYRPASGDWQPVSLTMSHVAGLRRSVNLDGPVAQFVAGLDGTKPLGERINELAELSGADVEEVRTESLPVIRTLMWQGLVLPTHDAH